VSPGEASGLILIIVSDYSAMRRQTAAKIRAR